MVVRANNAETAKPAYKILVSACLAGINRAYDGKNRLKKRVKELVDSSLAIPVCPEVLGGLKTPRAACEIVGGDGSDVLSGKAKVITIHGEDITKKIICGSRKVLKIARRYKIKKAVLKSNSPSCGVGKIYDGTFSGLLKKGNGVLASLLRQNGLEVDRES